MKRGVIAVALCALTTHAVADPATADRLAGEADALFQDGKFADAAVRFREAWNNDQLRPTLLCNTGISYYKAKDLVRAHLLLGECLEQSSLDPKISDNVRKALASSEAVLRAGGNTPVRIVSEPAASIAILELGSDEAFVGSRVVWLPFGRYHVRAHAEGYVDQTQAVITQAPDPTTMTITLERVKIEAPPIIAPPVVSTAPSRPGIALPIATSAVTVGAIIFAVVARGQAGTKADRAASALDPSTFESDKSAANRWNTTFVVGTSVAVVGAVASVVLWRRALSAPDVEVHASARGFSLGYTARF